MGIRDSVKQKQSLCESIATIYARRWIVLINNIGEPFVYKNISDKGIRSLLRTGRGYGAMAKKYNRLAESWRLYFTRTSKLQEILNSV